MNVQTLEIFGFFSVIRALRLPFKNSTVSDSVIEYSDMKYPAKNDINLVIGGYNIVLGEKDLQLISTLVKNGDEHAKIVRGIWVSVEIDAPRYFWQEMDTYRIGRETLSSESTMHSEAKGLSGEELQKAKSEISEGLIQRRVVEFSYQTLRRIYFQRRHHRLPEWKYFCDWIAQLPIAEQVITITKTKGVVDG